MTYLSTDDTHLDTIIGLGFFITLGLFIYVLVAHKKNKKNGTDTKNFIVTDPATGGMSVSKKVYVILSLFIAGGIVAAVFAGAGEERIKDNFVANLKTKYDIQEVNTPLKGTAAKGMLGATGIVHVSDFRGQVINVTAGDETYDLVVTQDPVTFEPTLHDMPDSLDDIREKDFDNPDSYIAESLEK